MAITIDYEKATTFVVYTWDTGLFDHNFLTTSTFPSDYVFIHVYESIGTMLVTEGSQTTKKFYSEWSTTPTFVVTSWNAAITSAISTELYLSDPGEVASSLASLAMEGRELPPWAKAMGHDLFDIYTGIFLPRYTTKVSWYGLAAPMQTEAPTPSTEIGSGAAATMYPAITNSPPDISANATSTSVESTSTTVSSTTFANPESSETAPHARKTLAIVLPTLISAIFIIAGITIFLLLRRKHRKAARLESGTSTSAEPHSKYNAPPIFPHKPLARLSQTTFTTEVGGGTHEPDITAPQLPPLPELSTSPGEAEIPESQEVFELGAGQSSDTSSDDFGTHFSGLEDPFSDDIAKRKQEPMEGRSPGVLPSTCALRDGISHEEEQHRQVMDSDIGTRNASSTRRSSMSEQELRRMLVAFDSMQDQQPAEGNLQRRRSLQGLTGGDREGKGEGFGHSRSGSS